MRISLATPVTELGLTGRLPRVCRALGVKTVADLLGVRREHLLELRGVGVGTAIHLQEVQQRVKRQLPSDAAQPSGRLSSESVARPSSAQRQISLETEATELTLTGRLPRVCRKLGLETVKDILNARPDEIASLYHVGRGTVAQFQQLQSALSAGLRVSNTDAPVTVTCPTAKDAVLSGGPTESGTSGARAWELSSSSNLREALVGYVQQVVRDNFGATVWLLRHGLHPDCERPLWRRQVARRLATSVPRVHRAEKAAEKALRAPDSAKLIGPLSEHVVLALAASLGVCAVTDFNEALRHRFGWSAAGDCELYALLCVCGVDAWISRRVIHHIDYCTALYENVRRFRSEVRRSVQRSCRLADSASAILAAIRPDCLNPSRDCYGALFPCGARDERGRILPEPYLRGVFADLGLPRLGGRELWPSQVWSASGGLSQAATEPIATGVKEEPSVLLADSLRDVLMTVAARSVPNPRNLEIWRMRTGLASPSDGKPPTLDAVAERFNLTRERIRQIEMRAERRIRTGEAAALLTPVLEAAEAELARCLGICPLEHLAGCLCARLEWKAQPNENELRALLRITDSRIDMRDGIMQHPDRCNALARTLRRVAPRVAERFPEGRHIADFAHDLASAVGGGCTDPDRDCRSKLFSCGARHGQGRVIPEPYVRALLAELSPPIVTGDFICPPHVWTLRQGRRKKDVVRAALQVQGRPAHYSKIAEFVRQNNEHFRSIRDHDVHACLTLYQEFVPVDRGTYDLSDRRQDDGTVRKHVTTRQAVAGLIKEHGAPMSLQQILDRLVPEGFLEPNIHAALTTGRRFVEVGYRVYALREMVESGCKEGISAGRGLMVVDRDSMAHDVIRLGQPTSVTVD